MKTHINNGSTWRNDSGEHIELTGSYEAVRENVGSFITRPNSWTLDFAITEGGDYFINGKAKKWIRSSRVGRLYPPGTIIEYKTDEIKSPIKTIYVLFKIMNGDRINQFNWSENDHIRFIDSEQLLQRSLQKIVDTALNFDSKHFFMAQGYFCQVLNLLFTSKQLNPNEFLIQKSILTKEKGFSAKVKEILAANTEKKVSLEDIAKILNISKSNLSHKYRKENGESPLITHSRYKIEKAKMYLINGESQKSIAEALGYSDVFHFSKNFKSITGKTPTEFKKGF